MHFIDFSATRSHSLISHFFLLQSFLPLRYKFYLKYQYTEGLYLFVVFRFTNVKFSVLLKKQTMSKNDYFIIRFNFPESMEKLSFKRNFPIFRQTDFLIFTKLFPCQFCHIFRKKMGALKATVVAVRFLISCEVLTLLLYEYVETNISATSHNFFLISTFPPSLQKRKLSSL